MRGAGTQNAGLIAGGLVNPGSVSCTEEYDGSTWTAGGALITARYGPSISRYPKCRVSIWRVTTPVNLVQKNIMVHLVFRRIYDL
jgi:hypothetical protein